MTSTDTQQQRISILEGSVSNDYLESIKSGGSSDSDAHTAGDDGDQDVVEALSSYGPDTLDDVDAIDAEIEALRKKLDLIGSTLPESRCAEVHGKIEALQAAANVHSPYRTNTAEALATRIEVQR